MMSGSAENLAARELLLFSIGLGVPRRMVPARIALALAVAALALPLPMGSAHGPGAEIVAGLLSSVHAQEPDGAWAVARRATHATTIALDERTERIWSVNSDSDTVAAIDARKLVKLFEAPVGDNPRTLASGPDGTVWVVNQDDATISIVEGSDGRLRRRVVLPYASRPYGIAFSPAGDAAYVTLQAVGRLLKLNALSGAVEDATDVGPTPRGIAVTADGTRILVTRYLSPADRGEVVEVSSASLDVVRRISLAVDPGPDSPVSGRGVPNHLAAIVIAPDGRRAWVPSKKDNTGRGLHLSGERLGFETTTRTIVSEIDLVQNREALEARRDLDNRAMAVAVAFDPEGKHAFVALQGSNAVDVLDAASGNAVASIPGTGLAPQGLLVDSRGRLFVQNFLSRDIAIYDLTEIGQGRAPDPIRRIATAAWEPLPPEVLLGKQIFYNAADPRMGRDGYVSCAGCHIEGGSDGRVWDYSGRGAHGGGLRNTIALQGRAGMGHGPIHWRADMDEIQDFEILLRQTLQGRGFVSDEVFHRKGADWVFGSPNAGLSRELDALAAYMTTFTKVDPSPYRRPGGLMTTDALAGEAIFHGSRTGCATCHVSPRFTDSSLRRPDDASAAGAATLGGIPGLRFRMHDVGTLTEAAGDFRPNTLRALDTPTVKGVWATPPYLHDGSAATLMDVITTRNGADRHGRTSHLTREERLQLVAYLRQLDDVPVETSASVSLVADEPRQSGSANSPRPNPVRWAVRAGAHGGIRINSVTLEDCAGHPPSAPRLVSIHTDSNGEGQFGPGDTLLAQSPLAAAGSRTAVLPLHPPAIVPAGATVTLAAAVSTGLEDEAVSPPAAPANAYTIRLVDLKAEGLTSASPTAVTAIPAAPCQRMRPPTAVEERSRE